MVTEWSKKRPEETSIALRLLAQLNQREIVYNFEASRQEQELISHLLNLVRSIKPRSRLQKIKTLLENSGADSKQDLVDVIDNYFDSSNIFIDSSSVILRSFWICQKKDALEAAQEGIPLKLDTLVEENFTHEMSVKLHLDLISLTIGEEDDDTWNKEATDSIWKELVRAVPEVKPIILSWFADNCNIFDNEARRDLAEKLESCEDEWLRGLPEYTNAIDKI